MATSNKRSRSPLSPFLRLGFRDSIFILNVTSLIDRKQDVNVNRTQEGTSISETISKIGHRVRIRLIKKNTANSQSNEMELLKPALPVSFLSSKEN